MIKLFKEQPAAFNMIFMIEIWERFGFYTVQGVLTLYFIRFLGFNSTEAYYTFGAFSALVYGMVALGGYMGDKLLGTKRTIILGLFTLCLGYLWLSFADQTTVYLALGLICVGNGIFKANPSSLLARCYKENDVRLHGGFTLYYMSINLGSAVSLLLGPVIATKYGYGYAYFLSFLGLAIGIANYAYQRHYVANINNMPDSQPVHFMKWAMVILGIVLSTFVSAYLLQHVVIARNLIWVVTALVLAIYFFYMKQEQKSVRMRMLVALVLMVEGIIFFTSYQQMPTSLNLFAVHNVDPVFFGISIDPQSFQALNPLWIILMSPVLAALYARLNKKGVAFAVPYKFAAGMILGGISFILLYFARYAYNDNGIVSSWWLITSYFFQSTGELLVSALGVAMVAELVPKKNAGFVMGMWFLTPSVAGFIGATVASFTSLPENILPGVQSLFIYTQVFAWIGLVTLAIGIVLWMAAAPLTRIIQPEAKPLPQPDPGHLIIHDHPLP